MVEPLRAREQFVSSEPTEGIDALRRREVDRRHHLLSQWLSHEGCEALLLFDEDSFAWLTAGGRGVWGSPNPADQPFLFVTERHRCVVCSADQTSRLFEQELDGLGFQVKETPVGAPTRRLAAELAGDRRVAADVPMAGAVDASASLAPLRRLLPEFDQPRFVELCTALSHALEATCRMIEPGSTELEAGAHLAHRLLHHDLEPREVYVFSDDRADAYARPRPTDRRIERSATLLACARHRGLYACASRTTSFGSPSALLLSRFHAASMAAASCIRFSIPNETVGAVMKRAARIYQKTGYEFAYRDAPQGSLAGCAPRGRYFQLDDDSILEAGMPISWTPMVEGVPCASTLLVVESGNELLSFSEGWPALGVVVKGAGLTLPGVLVR